MLRWDAFLSLPVPADPHCPGPGEEKAHREERIQHLRALAAHPGATILLSNLGVHCLRFRNFAETSPDGWTGQRDGME